ncbi:MAG TPA: hypothetical protein VMF30_14295, partial [Pirellulales bacterium]|nr:hypothetical protein [Pirellulales bacterium]
AAGQMARKWNLPVSLVSLIETHTADPAAAGAAQPVQAAVRLSALLPAVCDEAWHEAAQFEAAYDALRPANAPPLVAVLEQLDREFADVAPALKVSVPARTVLASYQQCVAAASAC